MEIRLTEKVFGGSVVENFGFADPVSTDFYLCAFATLLSFHKISADPRQLRHELGHELLLSAEDLLRLAKRMRGVRAKRISCEYEHLARLPLLVLLRGVQGWFLLGKVDGDQAVVQRPGQPTRASPGAR